MLWDELSSPVAENNVPKGGVPMDRWALSRITLYEQLAEPAREMPAPANDGQSELR